MWTEKFLVITHFLKSDQTSKYILETLSTFLSTKDFSVASHTYMNIVDTEINTASHRAVTVFM